MYPMSFNSKNESALIDTWSVIKQQQQTADFVQAKNSKAISIKLIILDAISFQCEYKKTTRQNNTSLIKFKIPSD